MTERIVFTLKERKEMMQLYQWLKEQIGSSLEEGDEQKIRHHISRLHFVPLRCPQVPQQVDGTWFSMRSV